MGLFSSEFSNGSYELIITQSVSTLEIIIGKFLSAVIFMLFALLPTLLYPITLLFLGRLDLIALMVGLAITVFFNIFLKLLALLFPSLSNVMEFISGDYHFNSISRGVLDLRDIIYFLSITTIFLYLSNIVLQNRK